MLSGVGGLKAHQQMIDVAGNNLANVNTTSFKSSSVTFQELLAETLREASAPTASLGGTNPMQIGSGVITGAVNRDMSQGSLIYTGNPLDMAIEGAGYFTLNDGLGDRYTRVGRFAVDSEYYLIDPTTGYRVQRLGNEGVAEGFQDATSNDIRIPYDIALPANATETVSFAGNLSGNKNDPTRNLLTSDEEYSIAATGAVASRLTALDDLTQATGALSGTVDTLANLQLADKITVAGMRQDGTSFNSTYYYNDGSATSERVFFDTGNAPATAGAASNFITNANAGNQDIVVNFAGETVTLTVPAATTWTPTDFTTAWNAAAANSSSALVDGQVVLMNTAAPGTATGNSFAVTSCHADITWASTSDNIATTDTHYFDGAAAGDADTVGNVLDFITSCFDEDGTSMATATMVNGEIRVEDNDAGYSQSFIDSMTFTDTDTSGNSLTMPSQFDILTAGGELEKPINVDVFDAQGNSYTLAGSFVRRDDNANQWDFVVKSCGGDTVIQDRFVRQIGFQVDGSYGDMQGSDANTIEISFPSDPTNIRTITLDFGTLGELDGLTQFGGPSTAASNGQDGYAAGWLSTLSVSREGTLVGVFSNGIRRDIAALKIATFQNAAGLKSTGGNYYEPTANSGDPVPNKATEGGAGVCQGGAIEKSNVEVAEEFVQLIEAQNGYQANARTIKVANEMLRELTNLIR
jgi:flagellar hook protein FlgE